MHDRINKTNITILAGVLHNICIVKWNNLGMIMKAKRLISIPYEVLSNKFITKTSTYYEDNLHSCSNGALSL